MRTFEIKTLLFLSGLLVITVALAVAGWNFFGITIEQSDVIAHRFSLAYWFISALVIIAAFTLAVTGWMTLRQVIIPLRRLTNGINTFVQGKSESALPEIDRKDEVGDLARAIELLRVFFSQRTQELEAFSQKNQELEKRLRCYTLLTLEDIANTDRYELEPITRRHAQSIFLGDHLALCRVLGRYKVFVDTRDVGFAGHLMLDGYWEMWLTTFVARTAKPGMVVADIGANFGYYTLLLADIVGGDGRVIAVEPNPTITSTLRRSVDLNGFGDRTTILAAAAGRSSEGYCDLYVPATEPKNATIVSDGFKADPAAGMVHRVPRIKIDDAIARYGRCDFVKIDAEAAEEDIIAGMLETIEKFRPKLVVEYNARRYKEPKKFLEQLLHCYGKVEVINYSGQAEKVGVDEIVSREFGEDRLLYFEG